MTKEGTLVLGSLVSCVRLRIERRFSFCDVFLQGKLPVHALSCVLYLAGHNG